MKRKKLNYLYHISDETLVAATVPAQVVSLNVQVALNAMEQSLGAEEQVDWTTLDLRLFHDVNLETKQRDHFLTLRATALTRGES